MRVAEFVRIVTVNVSVKNRDVLIGSEQVHHVVAVAGKPLPLGLKVKQRTMGEDNDRRGLWEPIEIFLQPGKLLGTDFRLGARDIVERDEVNATMIEGVITLAKKIVVHRAL